MTFSFHLGRTLACLVIFLAAIMQTSIAQTAIYGPHVWDKPVDPAVFEKRVNDQLDLTQKSIDQLLAVKGARNVENTLVPYDNAIRSLDTAGYQSGLMQTVSPEAAIRDRAQAMIQKVSAVATALALNQGLYHALVALDVSKADSATQYYVSARCWNSALPASTKTTLHVLSIKTLNDDITKLATQFERNLQESAAQSHGQKRNQNSTACPTTSSNRTSRQPTAASRSPAILLTLPRSEIRQESPSCANVIFLAYNNRAYPQNIKVLADLLKKREELANVARLQTLGRHERRRQDGRQCA